MAKSTVTKFGVADGERIIGDLFDDVDTARRHEVWVKETSAQLGVESPARLVTVEVTTTTGRPHVYREPAEVENVDEPAQPEPAIGQVPAPAASKSAETSDTSKADS